MSKAKPALASSKYVAIPSPPHLDVQYVCDVNTIIQYGAEMMESSVKSISRPVIDRYSLDEFACQQLDRVRSILSSPASFLSRLCFYLSAFLIRVLISRFSSGATVLARDDRRAPTQMSAVQALNANENGDAAVASRVHKYVT
jgi:hypothetical protein